MKLRTLKVELIMRLVAYAVVGLLLARAAYGQNWVEQQTYVSGARATLRIDGLFTSSAKRKVGSFVWMQVQQAYSQAYAGVTYSPKPFVQLALGAGLESDKHPARIGSYLWLGKGKVSGLGVFEDGGSGFWYKVETNYQATPKLGIGTLSERFRGHGLKLEVLLPRTPVKLWFAPLIKDRSVRPLFGLRWNL